MGVERIDQIIRDLWRETTELKALRDGAAAGTDLYNRRQIQMDVPNYMHIGYTMARPVLAELYDEFDAMQNSRTRHIRNAAEDAAMWARGAAFAGISSAVLLLVAFKFNVAWWVPTVGVVLALACAFAVFAALNAHNDRPNDGRLTALAGRIAAIERACECCQGEESLDALARLLHPQPSREVMHRTL